MSNKELKYLLRIEIIH